MKTIHLLFLSIALPFCVSGFIGGCATAPTDRVVAVQTMQALGSTAKASMDASTDLLKRGAISVEQWQNIAVFYDTRWQPAFNLAVVGVRSDLSSVASPDLMALAVQFTDLVAQLTETH